MCRTGVVYSRGVGGERANTVLTQFKNRKLYKKTFKSVFVCKCVCVSFTEGELHRRRCLLV